MEFLARNWEARVACHRTALLREKRVTGAWNGVRIHVGNCLEFCRLGWQLWVSSGGGARRRIFTQRSQLASGLGASQKVDTFLGSKRAEKYLYFEFRSSSAGGETEEGAVVV